MILSGQTIRKIRPLIVSPFSERQVHEMTGMSWGLSCAGYDIRLREHYRMRAGEFILGSSIERFEMPNDILGQVTDKSSLARYGLAVQNTIIEPGWRGYLTLEITNHSGIKHTLWEGQPIAQIIFYRLDEPTEIPYSGKYQDQPPLPVKPIKEV